MKVIHSFSQWITVEAKVIYIVFEVQLVAAKSN